MKTLTVNLGKNSYDIIIEKGLLSQCGDSIARVYTGDRIAIVTDENVEKYHLKTVVDSLEACGFTVSHIALPPGEQTKSLDTLKVLYSYFVEAKVTRTDLIIALGGGVIGDITGFAAATYLRGVPFVQIPTSLLAQVDSSVGGKVAADIPEGKNLAGVFYQPKRVLIDENVLDTLEPKFYADGMGEVIKHACINDADMFHSLMDNSISREEMLFTNCKIKSQVVEKDERDFGERMLLNFGHTIGHAIETYYNFEKYTHGEAVGIGMYTITKISENKGLTAPGTSDKIMEILKKYKLPFKLPRLSAKKLMEIMTRDKKNIDESLNIILIKDIGNSFIYKTDISFFEGL